MKNTRPCCHRVATCVCLLLLTSSSLRPQTDATPGSSDPDNIDVRLFRSINNHHTAFLDGIIEVNDYTVTPTAIAAPIGLITYGLISRSDHETDSGLLLGLSALVSEGATQAMKYIVKRDRPCTALADVNVSHLDSADPYSFPSGHATVAFAVATMLTLRYPRLYVAVPLYAWAALVGYGRPYLGLHYPTDVLAGAVIGSAVAVAVYLIQDRIIEVKDKLLGRSSENNAGSAGNVSGRVESRKGISVSFLPSAHGGSVCFMYRF